MTLWNLLKSMQEKESNQNLKVNLLSRLKVANKKIEELNNLSIRFELRLDFKEEKFQVANAKWYEISIWSGVSNNAI